MQSQAHLSIRSQSDIASSTTEKLSPAKEQIIGFIGHAKYFEAIESGKYNKWEESEMDKVPVIDGIEIDLENLFNQVCMQRGGAEAVDKARSWSDVAFLMGFPASAPASCTQQLRDLYMRFLSQFEQQAVSKENNSGLLEPLPLQHPCSSSLDQQPANLPYDLTHLLQSEEIPHASSAQLFEHLLPSNTQTLLADSDCAVGASPSLTPCTAGAQLYNQSLLATARSLLADTPTIRSSQDPSASDPLSHVSMPTTQALLADTNPRVDFLQPRAVPTFPAPTVSSQPFIVTSNNSLDQRLESQITPVSDVQSSVLPHSMPQSLGRSQPVQTHHPFSFSQPMRNYQQASTLPVPPLQIQNLNQAAVSVCLDVWKKQFFTNAGQSHSEAPPPQPNINIVPRKRTSIKWDIQRGQWQASYLALNGRSCSTYIRLAPFGNVFQNPAFNSIYVSKRYSGVYLLENSWRVQMVVQGTYYELGPFSSEEAAAEAIFFVEHEVKTQGLPPTIKADLSFHGETNQSSSTNPDTKPQIPVPSLALMHQHDKVQEPPVWRPPLPNEEPQPEQQGQKVSPTAHLPLRTPASPQNTPKIEVLSACKQQSISDPTFQLKPGSPIKGYNTMLVHSPGFGIQAQQGVTMKEPSKKRRRPNLNLPREKKIGSAKGTAQYQSNLQGVTWNKSKECWEVTNHDGQGRKKRKTFSVKTYHTIEAAKAKAEEFRRIQLAQKFEQSSDPSKFAGKYYQEVLCEVSASAPMPTPTSSSPAPPSPAQPPPLQSTQSQEQNVRFV